MSHEVHAHTPTLSVVESRGLPVRLIACHRQASADTPVLRVTRHSYDPAGRMIASQDPRLPTPNQRTVYSLSGQALLTDSVDAGWRLGLPGEAGQMLHGWDSRGSQRQTEYDELLRPVVVIEQNQAVERFTYGGPEAADDNQCNQLTRHDDTAGTLYRPDYGLLGSPLTEVRHFLRDLDMPDWPQTIPERDALLEADGFESGWVFNALGEVIEQTDAMGNTRHFEQTVAGQLKAVALAEQIVVSEIRYNAFDQVEQETAGNGVISRSTYDLQNGRLNELSAGLADASPLQLLKYNYDPVGNIVEIEDAAQPVRFFANQRIEPINHYGYDTLYQLIEATGREVKTDASHGPGLPELQNLPPDPNQVANYTQNYKYDAGGNLLEMRHLGAQPFTRLMRVAPDSNRSLPVDEVDVDFDNGFDANGNLQQLVRGQDLVWDVRNQLRQISTVQRDDGPSDNEIYIYDGGGQRCRKVSSAQASSRTLSNEVRYLPGLEIRSNAEGEIHHVITVNNVRKLHWPAGTHSDQLRYSLSDHLGSSTLELDQQGGLISQESYYPFGGTAWWAARGAVEAKYKTVRYSGKERDASGLYYYGFRYYAPWLQRWINPDPAGDVDGLNVFRLVKNNPSSFYDNNGAITTEIDAKNRKIYIDEGLIARLKDVQLAHAEQYDFIKSSYTHDIEKAHTILSEYSHPDYKFPDYFKNKFTPSKWTFKENFKHVRTLPSTHADEIATEQYLRVSEAENFTGKLPSLIKISLVMNKGVIGVANKYRNSPQKLMDKFLTTTQNGKSTQRILDTFGLRATRVEARFTKTSDLDIYIHVEPASLTPIGPPATPEVVLPSTTAHSRFTVTPTTAPKPPSRFTVTPAQVRPSVSRFSVTPVTKPARR